MHPRVVSKTPGACGFASKVDYDGNKFRVSSRISHVVSEQPKTIHETTLINTNKILLTEANSDF